eukprot:scaffold10715_cov114-Isochrysis_galbana.AAC.18
MPSGSKPQSPTIVPSSAAGRGRNGTAMEREAAEAAPIEDGPLRGIPAAARQNHAIAATKAIPGSRSCRMHAF